MAIEGLINILTSVFISIETKRYYLNLCITHFLNGDNYIENCKLFKRVASTFKRPPDRLIDEFNRVEKDHGSLISLIIGRLEVIADGLVI